MESFAETYLHVDMDAFFVEVERGKDRRLRGVPVVVGGLGRRGVVASASYEARRYGVRSAMPMGRARRLCPQARFVSPDHQSYRTVSAELFDLLHGFTPEVEGLSIDEAFLGIGGLRLHYESPTAVGAALRRRIRDGLGLPASVGIAAVKFLCKLASDSAKPDGLLLVPTGEELGFLHPMPVRRLWGVGQATHATLEGLGVRTIGDLATVPEMLLEKHLGPALARHLAQLARGIDPRGVSPIGKAKSISVEITFEEDLVSDGAVEDALFRLCEQLAGRLRKSGHAGATLHLKVRFAGFVTVSRSTTAADPIAHAPDLWKGAMRLMRSVHREGRGVRLLGVGIENLVDGSAARQLRLGAAGLEAVADAADAVRDRFGDRAVMPARLAPRKGPKDGDE